MSDAHKRPASQNPWYVLATLAGEQKDGIDKELCDKNRYYWNAWASQNLTAEEKTAVKDADGYSILQDTPEWEDVKDEVAKRFAERLPEADLPDPSDNVRFHGVQFQSVVSFNGFLFSEDVSFMNARFSGDAEFGGATFSKDADFMNARFSEGANFIVATFLEYANFMNATFSENAHFGNATFPEDANFMNATFSGVQLRDLNLEDAHVLGAHVRTRHVEGERHPTDLSTCIGLRQEQLDHMNGDSGTLLPEGLKHPDHWPKLDDPAPEKVNAPFIFLSYAHTDQTRAGRVVEFLKQHGFNVWWDDKLASGDEWRKVIDQHLNQASAVFTLWTQESVESKSVKEEASRAQSAHKLVHARLDQSKLPYGFGETQYETLIGWDCSSDTPEALRLVEALRRKVATPSAADLAEGLTRASDVEFAPRNGMMTMGDRPLGVAPEVLDPADMQDRVEAQHILIGEIKLWIEQENPNLNQRDLLTSLNRYDQMLRRPSINWYSADGAVKTLNNLIVREDARQCWPELLVSDLDILIEDHVEMRPLIRPRQPEPSSPDAIQPAPLAALPPDFDGAHVVEDMSAILQSEDLAAIADDSVVTFFKDQLEDIKYAQEAEDFSDAKQDNKNSWLRRVLSKTAVRMAAFVKAVSVQVVAPTTVAVLINPEAGARLLALVQKLLDKLLALFGVE